MILQTVKDCKIDERYIKVINTLPNDKILAQSKLRALGDDKVNVNEKLKFVLGRAENILGKGENVFSSIFSYFHNVFKSLLPQGFYKSGWCGKGLNLCFC